MNKMSPIHFQLTRRITESFAALPQVEAVAVAGSLGNGLGRFDAGSDIDLYIYTRAEIPPEIRQTIVERAGGASRSDFNLNYWGAGDLWVHASTGIELDMMYFDASWMEEQIERVIKNHQPALGYTTCFWYTVHQSIPFFDSKSWFSNLQQICSIAYPETLRRNIIDYNHPALRGIITSYAAQIDKAVKRHDLVSINHRLAALLASYFDILFAVNRQLHPGEKRQVEFAIQNCQNLPENMENNLASILQLTAGEIPQLPERISGLLDRLDQILAREGYLS